VKSALPRPMVADVGHVELDHGPDNAARTLVKGRTDTVGLVISEAHERVFGDPFLASMVRGVSRAVMRADLQCVVLWAQGRSDHDAVERFVTQGHVDGVVLLSLHEGDRMPDLLTAAGIPTVLSGRPMGLQRPVTYVDADSRGGGALATRHLIAQGRRRIAMITGPLEMPAGIDRFDGYCDAMREAGRPVERSLVAEGDFTERGGADQMARLLEREPGLDAVFVASDTMAIGALHALDRAGRRVPDDVAVIGFDDVPMAEFTQPALTTVRQPLDEMAVALAERLIAQLGGDAGAAVPDHVVFPTELVERASA
jgi:DNA-binding LacI/PurR family transcriptional regulator